MNYKLVIAQIKILGQRISQIRCQCQPVCELCPKYQKPPRALLEPVTQMTLDEQHCGAEAKAMSPSFAARTIPHYKATF